MCTVKRPPPELGRSLLDASDEILRPDRTPRLEDVATLVGAARATLYYYFSGRDDLIGFLLEEHLGEAAAALDAAVMADQPPAARLRSAVAALVGFLGARPGVIAGLLSFAGTTGRLHTVHAAKDALLVTPVRKILDDGVSAGQFVIDDSRDAAHAVLGGAMVAALSRWHDGEDPASATFQRALVDQLVRGVGG